MTVYSPTYLARLLATLAAQPASSTTAGTIKPDGTTTQTAADGTLSVVEQTLNQLSPSAALADTHIIPTLAAGAAALGTNSAAQLAAYVATKIPAGATGPAGPQGPTGPQGPQGAAAPFGASMAQVPTAPLDLRIVASTTTLPTGLSTSIGRATTVATAQAVFTLGYRRNGTVTAIGTATFAAGATAATFASAAAVTLQPGDVPVLTPPSPPDATLAGVALAFVGS